MINLIKNFFFKNSDDKHETFFGIWHAKGIKKVLELLGQLGARFRVEEHVTEEDTLKSYIAWDSNSNNPNMGYYLWIRTDDLTKVGTKIVDMFPEKKFE